MHILGIETSCDDTCAAVIEGGSKRCRILSNVVSSQIKVHAPYGGVVPNLAARAHLKNIPTCLRQALEQAGRPKIDSIAVTVGPGLIPSLLVGVNFAKALAYANRLPIRGINHMEGHIYANWIESESKFPVLCLIVSGGHTQLVLMKDHGKYKLLGETRDDAAGEAFDKTAKLLGLGYPGGPIVSKRAAQGNAAAFNFPRPMLNKDNFDFSFSGLKTSVLYKFKSVKKPSDKTIDDFCASFQQAAVDVLVRKTIKAAKEYRPKTIILSGGVAANTELRRQMKEAIHTELSAAAFSMPARELCTDNAAMIAAAAFYAPTKEKQSWSSLSADANLRLA